MTTLQRSAQIAATVLLAAVMTGALLTTAGLLAGWRAVVITTASMGGAAPPGTLIAVSPVDGDQVAIGDVIVMQTPGHPTVTHRVIDIDVADGRRVATTRGDANPAADASPYPLDGEQLVRRTQVRHLGWFLHWLRDSIVQFGGVVFAVAILTFLALRHIWTEVGRPRPPVGIVDPASWGRVPPKPRRRPMKAVVGTAVAVSLVTTGGSATALFTGTSAVSSNDFVVSDCFEARVDTVQSGQLITPGNGTFDVAVSPVDPQTSFLLYSTSSNSNEPADSIIGGQLLNGSTVRFTRATDLTGPSVVIEWSLVTYACGVSVQRGSATGNGTTQLDVPITAIDQASSFVVAGAVGAPTATAFDGDDQFSVELADTSTVRFRSGAQLPTSTTYTWQVVTLVDSSDASVQQVTGTLTAGQGSTSVALPVTVDPSRTIVLASARSAETGADIGEQLVRVHLISPTAVDIQRLVTTGSVVVSIQVVSLDDGTFVQHGTVDFTPGQTTRSIPLDAVDRSRTTAISTVQSTGSQALGSTDMVSDDVVGEASARFDLPSSTEVLLTRDAATASASFGWQVIEWSGPPWWDQDAPVRHRVDVTAGTPGAPDQYTVTMSFDHSALVAAGLSAPSGDDVRLLRWDGLTWTELDRILEDGSTWNAADTTMLFSTRQAIAPASTISYWLYAGDDAPDPPRNDPENVWLLYETFESGTTGDFVDRTGGSGWYQADPWVRQIDLTISPSDVPADQTDLRVLVQLTEPDLVTWAQTDGSDIRFVAGATPLLHDLEWYDSTTGELTAWVEVPNVSSSVATIVTMRYGAGNAPSQANAAGAWSTDRAVWHLGGDPSGPAPQAEDSTDLAHDGLASGSMTSGDLVTGRAGRGLHFDGVDDRLLLETVDGLSSGLTVSAWFRADAFGTDPRIFTKATDAADTIIDLGIDDSSTTTGQLRARLRIESVVTEISGGAVSAGSWHHVALTYDSSNVTLYLDGSAVATAPRTGTIDPAATMATTIGGFADASNAFQGVIDEVRVRPTAVTASHLGIEVANQGNPAGFTSPSAPTANVTHAVGPWFARKPLSLDASLVAATQADTAVLVQIVDADLAADAQASGADIVFTAGDGVTRLDHEIEAWDGPSGALTAWVRVPSIDASTDTELFVYYDNNSAVDQQDPSAVFGAGHDAVWHLAPSP